MNLSEEGSFDHESWTEAADPQPLLVSVKLHVHVYNLSDLTLFQNPHFHINEISDLFSSP